METRFVGRLAKFYSATRALAGAIEIGAQEDFWFNANKNQMDQNFTHEQLPSGKTIMCHTWISGLVAEETHGYGLLEIAIKFDYRDGKKVDETYFVNKRMVSRKTYEKARVKYIDMPASDESLEDSGATLLRMVAAERKARRLRAKQHKPNPEQAKGIDAFCQKLMGKGKTEDAKVWIEDKRHLLGEMDWRGSKHLVSRLTELGCVRILACKIDVYDDGMENTGHLVVELPSEPSARNKILRMIDRQAEQVGYTGDPDDGQRYAYIKLD